MANKQKDKPNDARRKKPDVAQESQKLLRESDRLIQQAVLESDFGQLQPPRTFPVFDASEIIVGPFLGEGAFGIVHEVEQFRLKQQHDDDETSTTQIEDDDDEQHYDIEAARAIMKENVRRNGDARYAIKKLHTDLDDRERARGMIDLYIEVNVLERLFHPNIVKMRGTSTSVNERSAEFFFLMDRLYGTLQDKILVWKEELPKPGGVFKRLLGKSSPETTKQLANSFLTRITVAYDLSSAFSYMHKRHLVYRDIKQDNIGFDVRGDVKIFDFGISKGLSDALRARDESTGKLLYGYRLTARSGSIPYMAPEVVLCKPYDSKADVFSFAILLWEILSLQNAFPRYNKLDYLQQVCNLKLRPKVPRKDWPPFTTSILKEAWLDNPEKRPTMQRISNMIRGDMKTMSTDDSVRNRTEHLLNRSRRSMRMRKPKVEELLRNGGSGNDQ